MNREEQLLIGIEKDGRILDTIRTHPGATVRELSELAGEGQWMIRYRIRNLQVLGLIDWRK